MLVMMLKNQVNSKNTTDSLSSTQKNDSENSLKFDNNAAMATLRQLSIDSYAMQMRTHQL